MSEKLGPLTFGKREEQVFLGKDFNRQKDYSEKTAEEIDAEVRRVVSDRYDYAKQLLIDNREMLNKVAEALLEKESLDGAEIDVIVNGKKAEVEPEVKKEVKEEVKTEAEAKEPEKDSDSDADSEE